MDPIVYKKSLLERIKEQKYLIVPPNKCNEFINEFMQYEYRPKEDTRTDVEKSIEQLVQAMCNVGISANETRAALNQFANTRLEAIDGTSKG